MPAQRSSQKRLNHNKLPAFERNLTLKSTDMPILEDDVKRTMEAWLKAHGYSEVMMRLGTRQGYDVEAKDPTSGKLLAIECKGEASTGDQWSRSWTNVAYAMLTALNETENPQKTNEVGLALPDGNHLSCQSKTVTLADAQHFPKSKALCFMVSDEHTNRNRQYRGYCSHKRADP